MKSNPLEYAGHVLDRPSMLTSLSHRFGRHLSKRSERERERRDEEEKRKREEEERRLEEDCQRRRLGERDGGEGLLYEASHP